jgi:hypothetical protein
MKGNTSDEFIKQIYREYSNTITRVTLDFEYKEYTISEFSKPKLIFFYEEDQLELKDKYTQKTQELKDLALTYEVKSFALNPLKTPKIRPGTSPILNRNQSIKYIKCEFKNNDELKKQYKSYLVYSHNYSNDEIDNQITDFDIKASSNKEFYKNLYVKHITNKFLLCYKNIHNENKRVSLCRGIFLPMDFKDKIRISSNSTSRIDKIQYENILDRYLKKV